MMSFAIGVATEDGDACTGGEASGVGDSPGVAAGAEAEAAGDGA